MRLIDAKKAVMNLSKRVTSLVRMGANPLQIYNEVLQVIAEVPTENGVTAVRCKTCHLRGNAAECPMCFREAYQLDEGDGYSCTAYRTHDRTVDDGYCDRGKDSP